MVQRLQPRRGDPDHPRLRRRQRTRRAVGDVHGRDRGVGGARATSPTSRHSRPCGGNPSVSRRCWWGGSPAIRWRFTCQRNQGFPPQGRE
ncbi:hypothetical protein DDF65_12455 [Caulobacter radicis]|uniref:Uncharacterized protein n=1 Tax=Caulobacter radicis TaxID=2172650 RepID=A0A2T9JE19_9CAUL|nr:hypothetical protein DDF65_12455 [Caulobacter radicis]